jgi:hypothetical protein
VQIIGGLVEGDHDEGTVRGVERAAERLRIVYGESSLARHSAHLVPCCRQAMTQ